HHRDLRCGRTRERAADWGAGRLDSLRSQDPRPGAPPPVHRRAQSQHPGESGSAGGGRPVGDGTHSGGAGRQRWRGRCARGLRLSGAARFDARRFAALPSRGRGEIPAAGARVPPGTDAFAAGRRDAGDRGGDGSCGNSGEDRRVKEHLMTERVARLRACSLETKPWLSLERARLLTEFYRTCDAALSIPVRRALSLAYLMERKTIYIGSDELIVGERGPAPKGTPSYPELCCHSMEDLLILDTREKISYRVSDEARRIQEEEVIPYWQGGSMRDRIFAEMTPEWKDAYAAGVFTEFMEQRAPGHTVLGDVIYRKGLLELQMDIDAALGRLDFLGDARAWDKQQELKAMRIAAGAVMRFAERHADLALSLADEELRAGRKAELRRIAEVCRRVPAHAPRDFHEALQAYWFVHLGVITELNTWDSFSPGRLDQHLAPFYDRGLASGTLHREAARELLECFWVKFNNQPAPPKVGVTAAESGTYTDFCNINTGGLKSDGTDGVGDVTYLILEVIGEMRLLQPSSNLQLSKKSPERFLKRGLEIVRQGWGQPSIFN